MDIVDRIITLLLNGEYVLADAFEGRDWVTMEKWSIHLENMERELEKLLGVEDAEV